MINRAVIFGISIILSPVVIILPISGESKVDVDWQNCSLGL
ncbi:MAG: hypothetical protein P9L98_04285 [Candidatus Kaelpia imicola]|nr:hypothetical protein [Candidatus Kaelpia imicola]